MAHLYGDVDEISPYIKARRKFYQSKDWDSMVSALKTSTTLYVGNLSFYTEEEQIYALFSMCGPVRRIIMGIHKFNKTPCGFCFVEYYFHRDAMSARDYINGTKLDERLIRVDIDPGFENGRQYGRGQSGGQVRDDRRSEYDVGRGGLPPRQKRRVEEQAYESGVSAVPPSPNIPQSHSHGHHNTHNNNNNNNSGHSHHHSNHTHSYYNRRSGGGGGGGYDRGNERDNSQYGGGYNNNNRGGGYRNGGGGGYRRRYDHRDGGGGGGYRGYRGGGGGYRSRSRGGGGGGYGDDRGYHHRGYMQQQQQQGGLPQQHQSPQRSHYIDQMSGGNGSVGVPGAPPGVPPMMPNMTGLPPPPSTSGGGIPTNKTSNSTTNSSNNSNNNDDRGYMNPPPEKRQRLNNM